MKSNPLNRRDHLVKLSYEQRHHLLEQLKEDLNWMDQYELKEKVFRTADENELYRQKSSSSRRISNQLSQHALIVRNQLAFLLTDTMEIMEIAMDMDPNDDEKYFAYRELRRAYVKFMRAFRRDFRNN